jgi:hypothetical protein
MLMSYVETCKTHGQYKGDYCGSCVERAFEQVSELVSQLSASCAEREKLVVENVSLQDQLKWSLRNEETYKARLAETTERVLELETENLKLSTMEPELARQADRARELERQLDEERMAYDPGMKEFWDDRKQLAERVLQLEKEVTRLKAELWVVNDRALRTYDGATEVPRPDTPAPRPRGSAKPWRCPQFRPGCSPCPDCQRVPVEAARERNTSPQAADVGTTTAQERKTFQQIRENMDAIIKRPPTAEQLADLDATLRATQDSDK